MDSLLILLLLCTVLTCPHSTVSKERLFGCFHFWEVLLLSNCELNLNLSCCWVKSVCAGPLEVVAFCPGPGDLSCLHGGSLLYKRTEWLIVLKGSRWGGHLAVQPPNYPIRLLSLTGRLQQGDSTLVWVRISCAFIQY